MLIEIGINSIYSLTTLKVPKSLLNLNKISQIRLEICVFICILYWFVKINHHFK